ncbi:MAG: hypothetical protein JSV77_10950 [Dehalococcoidales bacterium]|nr:MAG: hypothetical protein JSV77_10950 [Dehalococcoidales bacterium]
MKVREKATPPSKSKTNLLEYTHLPLGKDVPAFAGYYIPEKEVRIPFHEREILYIIGQVVVETACQEITCTPGGDWYAMVPGYILKWQYRKNNENLLLSKIETITDLKTRKEIEHLIREHEAVTRVEFR